MRPLHLHMLDVLSEAQRSRSPLADWNEYEISTMLREVNAQRAKLDKHPIERSDVEKADRLAAGHSDYSRKFALYCTQLVEGL